MRSLLMLYKHSKQIAGKSLHSQQAVGLYNIIIIFHNSFSFQFQFHRWWFGRLGRVVILVTNGRYLVCKSLDWHYPPHHFGLFHFYGFRVLLACDQAFWVDTRRVGITGFWPLRMRAPVIAASHAEGDRLWQDPLTPDPRNKNTADMASPLFDPWHLEQGHPSLAASRERFLWPLTSCALPQRSLQVRGIGHQDEAFHVQEGGVA